MASHRTRLIHLAALALATVIFGLVEQTTPVRFASLLFFILIGFYSFATHRNDVIIASFLFFVFSALNRYSFDAVLPLWITMIATTVTIGLAWFLLFGRQYWFLAIAVALLTVETIYSLQYINLESKTQAIIMLLPFLLASQYCYFQDASSQSFNRSSYAPIGRSLV